LSFLKRKRYVRVKAIESIFLNSRASDEGIFIFRLYRRERGMREFSIFGVASHVAIRYVFFQRKFPSQQYGIRRKR